MSEFGITNREITDDYKFDLAAQKNEIDYESVFKVIDAKRELSRDYLRTAIEK